MNLNLSSLMILISCQWSWKCRNNQSHPKKGLNQEMVHDKGFPFVLQPPDLRGPSMKLTKSLLLPFPSSLDPMGSNFKPYFHQPLISSATLTFSPVSPANPQIWINSTVSLLSLLCINGKRTHIIVLNYICYELNCVLSKLTVWSPKPQCDCIWNTKWLRLNEVIR